MNATQPIGFIFVVVSPSVGFISVLCGVSMTPTGEGPMIRFV